MLFCLRVYKKNCVMIDLLSDKYLFIAIFEIILLYIYGFKYFNLAWIFTTAEMQPVYPTVPAYCFICLLGFYGISTFVCYFKKSHTHL